MSRRKLTYWQRRYLQIAVDRDKKDLEYIRKMEAEYDRLSKSIFKELQGWMKRYADNEGISETEAYEQLSKSEQRTWSMTLRQFKERAIAGGYEQELNREYFKSRISRLEQLQAQLYFELAEMANAQDAAMAEHLKQQLQETYLRQIYEMTDRGSFSIAFDRFSSEALQIAISKPWKGGNFSRRVWKNHLKTLPEKLSKTMSVAISQGWGVDRTVKEMMYGIDSSLKNRMVTLVQTESAHLAEVASDKSMKETGVEKWEWTATLETHTCDRCAELDGQTFNRDDANAPTCPDHPNCRCTRVPVIEGWKTSTRWQRDPVTGKGSIEKYQTFEEWKKKAA
ncbi:MULTISPECIES: minor capsid protein [Enterococcus]|uniref:minor capsid protein n=1 Tax=Enterococcus TaxID=1350 RepID=UPI0022E61C59|nr:minor capsid protein [Enterococcus lactis]